MSGAITLIGTGPGALELCAPAALAALGKATIIVG